MRRTLFDQLDTDGSGGIDGDELAAGLAAQGYQVRLLLDRVRVTPLRVGAIPVNPSVILTHKA